MEFSLFLRFEKIFNIISLGKRNKGSRELEI